ncbi:MAG: DUF1028 domain-containing protein [Bacteroidia bacterium]|nr:DUF1028 domain-containing protein [Bacteroidia bacterium]
MVFLTFPLSASAQAYGQEPLAHTYSIVAYDPETGDMGVAVQSHWFAVGTIVAWGEAGVGVVATQSFVNPAFGPDGLAMLKSGLSAQRVLDSLIASDPGEAVRQLAVLNPSGAAAHTGGSCIRFAGHIVKDHVSVQANMMLSEEVPAAMMMAYELAEGSLAERLMAALEGAQAAGGDIRGKQSAAILVVSAESTGKSWVDRKVDLRIDDSEDPLKELRRLLTVHRAYEHMNAGDLAVEVEDYKTAMEEYRAAMNLYDDNVEMAYWTAVTLANLGRMEEAKPLFKKAFSENDNWRELTRRISENKILAADAVRLKEILEIE